MPFIFSKTRALVANVDNFLDNTARSVLLFSQAVNLFASGKLADFEPVLSEIIKLERETDNLRRDIESKLYRQALIPESRGDVLGILESMDVIINGVKKTVLGMSIEKFSIPAPIRDDFRELIFPVSESVRALVCSARSYFSDASGVPTYLNEVKYYENESDRHTEKILRKLFMLNTSLAKKNQIKAFINGIDSIADKAEDVSNRIAIAAIKRAV